MKKNLLAFITISIIILMILGLGYRLKGEGIQVSNNEELVITLSGGESIYRDNIKEVIFFKNEAKEIKYFQIIYEQERNQKEIYSFYRIASISYSLQLEERFKTKSLSELNLKN